MAERWQTAGFGLYLHWPFCESKCPYCDFNSHVAAEIDESRWKRAYLSEINRVAEELPGRVLSTVFFGGGTPSLMSPDLVAAILERVRSAWSLSNDAEITLEANPSSVEADRFRGFREAGVNRVSLGVQALRDADLKRLGRLHTVAEARRAMETAQATFDRTSFDLIYARQDQTLEDWRGELADALALAADHLSLYQLTIEPGTAFGARFERGLLAGLPDEDRAADLFEVTQEMTEAAGLTAYEVSNHARPGDEARHNLIYWRSGDWAGIGPGAHGRYTRDGVRLATETTLSPLGWLRAVELTGSGEERRTPVSARDGVEETLMMGLRLREGVAVQDLPRDPDLHNKINVLQGMGLVELSAERLRTTPAGRPVLNAVLRELLA